MSLLLASKDAGDVVVGKKEVVSEWAKDGSMKLAGGFRTVVALGCIAAACERAAALPPPPSTPWTLWNFLGIPQGLHKIRDATSNKYGLHPGHERLPPLKALADPANMLSPNPAIAAAAKIKAEEDMAPQKIKAIKYLATIGCGCYSPNGEVKDALLNALDDCTEEVRYQAAIAIEDASHEHCSKCNQNCCCDQALTEKLSKVAYEKDENDCFVEPSERVREACKRAMCECCSKGGRLTAQPGEPSPAEPLPPEGPPPEGAPTPAPGESEEVRGADDDVGPEMLSRRDDRGKGVSRATYTTRDFARAHSAMPKDAVSNKQRVNQRPQPPAKGIVARVNTGSGTVEVRTDRFSTLNVGDRLKVSHRYLLDVIPVGYLEVIAVGRDAATAQPIDGLTLNKIARGDEVLFQPTRMIARRGERRPPPVTPPHEPDANPRPTEAKSTESKYTLELKRETDEPDQLPSLSESTTDVSQAGSPETFDGQLPFKAEFRR